jgi:Zn-dependent oligopeptidase
MGVGGKMPAEIARARFAAAGNLDKLDDYGYAYGGDIYGGEMDMDAMYNMMKGGSMYQQGGQQQDPVMQAIQMYAQMTEMDPEQLMQQLQALPPLEQQEAIQKIMQAIQEAQSPQMKKGGIYINPANKGKFTASANRAGMGVQEFARHVLANKEDYSSTQVKRANFARNAAKWKKQMGGMTEGQMLELHDDEIQNLIDQGYGIEYLD